MTLEDNWSIQEMPPPRREFAGRLFFMNQEIPILVVVDDLLFASMILETARRLGVAVEAVKIEDLGARVRQGPVRSVIIDLNHRSGAAIEAVRALKAESSWRGIVCGFVSHVQSDVIQAARTAECDEVLARSAFARDLPRLLSRLAGRGGERPPKP